MQPASEKMNPNDIQDLKKLNQDSIDALQAKIDKLLDLKDGLPLDQRASVLHTISDLQTRMRTLQLTQEHMSAAAVVVEFTPAEQASLKELADKLDGFIAED